MRFFIKSKDGGIESRVYGYWLFESKRFGSICLLNFKKDSRDAYHTHAFDAISWVLYGQISEIELHYMTDYHYTTGPFVYKASLKPIFTPKDKFHKVSGITDNTWVLSFRGGWVNRWKEYLPREMKHVTLTHGRKEV